MVSPIPKVHTYKASPLVFLREPTSISSTLRIKHTLRMCNVNIMAPRDSPPYPLTLEGAGALEYLIGNFDERP